jgi:hypothetical protein
VVGSFENSIDSSGSIKFAEFLDHLNNYQRLNELVIAGSKVFYLKMLYYKIIFI